MTTRTLPLRREKAGTRERRAWLILAVLLLFSIAAPLNQFKIPPIMPLLMASLKLSIGGAGTLMSVYALTGVVLALPSGLIFQRLGYKWTGVIAGASLVLGAALGALSSTTGLLLASRVIEGAGTTFMAVLAPAIIAPWFRAEKRGMALGIWAAWVPLGTAAMLVAAPALAQGAGWRAVWWLGAAYALFVTALYVGVVRPAPGQEPEGVRPAGGGGPAAPAPVTVSVLRNRNLWLLSGAFAFFCAAGIGLSSYLPTFLTTAHGLPLAQASLLASVATLISIGGGPLGGAWSDRIRSRKRPYLAGLAAMVLLVPLTGFVSIPVLLAVVVLQGVLLGLVPTNVFAASVELAGDERQGGLAMAVIMLGQNAGMLLGPAVFGALVDSAAGWPAAFASLGVMALLGVGAGWLARVR